MVKQGKESSSPKAAVEDPSLQKFTMNSPSRPPVNSNSRDGADNLELHARTEPTETAGNGDSLKSLTFAHSPDPDDAYMFYGFASEAIKIPGYEVKHHLEDIQTLNERALKGEFEITAVSAHAYAHLTDKYWVLSCGASVGRKYGPILVTKNSIPHPHPLPSPPLRLGGSAEASMAERERESEAPGEGWRIAIPGKWTTAALVLDLWLADEGRQVETVVIPFDQILDAVAAGTVDAGLIIHEGQLTYQRQGLHKYWDAGEWWHLKTGLPLPLGLDVVRIDLGLPLARKISWALRDSILYANAHPEKAMAYALEFGRGLDTALGKRFVGMYVNEDTLNQGQEVQDGLKKLYELAFRKKLIPQNPSLTFI